MANEITNNTDLLSQQFQNIEMSRQKITQCQFEDCQFQDCLFDETIFDRCKFVDCRFVRCNFSQAKLLQSKFADVFFEACKLIGIDWTKGNWPKWNTVSPIQFKQCVLNDSSFNGLHLEEIVLENCKAHDVDFRDGDFTDANFSETDFTGSLFQNTRLVRADFSDATNYDIDIYLNDVKGAKFARLEATRLLEFIGIELVD